MNTSVGQTKCEARGSVQEYLKVAEGQKMGMASDITKLKARISRNMTSSIAVKLVGGFALGAFLVTTAIGLTFGSTSADATTNPSSTAGVEVSTKVERVNGFLSQGQAGYSLEEQMEIAGTGTAPVSTKVERVNGFLSQGQAGYSLEEQMEVIQE